MGLGQVGRNGNKIPIAGLNSKSGELVPSGSYYQTGSVSLPALEAGASQDITITLPNAMPDNNYVVVAYPGYPAYTFSYTPVSATQFTISVKNQDDAAHGEGLIRWRAFKLMTDESRALDEQAIADNTSAIEALSQSSNGTGTRNASYVSATGYAVQWVKVGRLVTLSLSFVTSVALDSSELIITGLPKPTTTLTFSTAGSSGTEIRNLVLTTAGAIRTHYGCPANASINGTLTYIAAS